MENIIDEIAKQQIAVKLDSDINFGKIQKISVKFGNGSLTLMDAICLNYEAYKQQINADQ